MENGEAVAAEAVAIDVEGEEEEELRKQGYCWPGNDRFLRATCDHS